MELEEKIYIMYEEFCKLQTIIDLVKEVFEKNKFEMINAPNELSCKNLWYNKEYNVYASLIISDINKLVMGCDIDKSNNKVIVAFQATFKSEVGFDSALQNGTKQLCIKNFG
jgi:hypothetical protein